MKLNMQTKVSNNKLTKDSLWLQRKNAFTLSEKKNLVLSCCN